MTISRENRGDYMNVGDVLICIDPEDEHYLQVGYVNLIDPKHLFVGLMVMLVPCVLCFILRILYV